MVPVFYQIRIYLNYHMSHKQSVELPCELILSVDEYLQACSKINLLTLYNPTYEIPVRPLKPKSH